MKVLTAEQFRLMSYQGKMGYLNALDKFIRPTLKKNLIEQWKPGENEIFDVIKRNFETIYSEFLNVTITNDSLNYYFKKSDFRFVGDGEYRLYSFIEVNLKNNLEWNV